MTWTRMMRLGERTSGSRQLFHPSYSINYIFCASNDKLYIWLITTLIHRQRWWKSWLEELSHMWCGIEWRYSHHHHHQPHHHHINTIYMILIRCVSWISWTENHSSSPYSSFTNHNRKSSPYSTRCDLRCLSPTSWTRWLKDLPTLDKTTRLPRSDGCSYRNPNQTHGSS